MHDTPVFAADLQEKITEHGWTRKQFTSRYPKNPEHIGKIVRGARPITLSFSLECARLFEDGITVQQGGERFVILSESQFAALTRASEGDREGSGHDDEAA